MEEKDYIHRQSGLNGMLLYKSVLTQGAPPNEDYEVHTHYREFELYRFLEGDLLFAFEGKHIKVEEGMVILIANGVLHRPILQSRCRYRRERILFDQDVFLRFSAMDLELCNRLKNKRILVLLKERAEQEGIPELIGEVGRFLAQQTPYGDFCALISLFSLLIKAEACGEHTDGMQVAVYGKRIAEMISYIDEHLAEDLSYKVLSERFCLSERSLYKFFKKEAGFSLGNYIAERRILLAQSVLSAGGTAKAAAYSAGFKDYSVFYRCFLKRVGMSPAEYQKSKRLSLDD